MPTLGIIDYERITLYLQRNSIDFLLDKTNILQRNKSLYTIENQLNSFGEI